MGKDGGRGRCEHPCWDKGSSHGCTHSHSLLHWSASSFSNKVSPTHLNLRTNYPCDTRPGASHPIQSILRRALSITMRAHGPPSRHVPQPVEDRRLRDLHASTRTNMASPTSEYVTLVSCDGFEFIIPRSAACVSGTIRRMLDPSSRWAAFRFSNSSTRSCC
jgi:hypothetical protein